MRVILLLELETSPDQLEHFMIQEKVVERSFFDRYPSHSHLTARLNSIQSFVFAVSSLRGGGYQTRLVCLSQYRVTLILP